MATYITLNIIFLIVASIAAYFSKSHYFFDVRSTTVTLVSLLVLTAIFDNLIILSGIVDYREAALLGVYLGVAPIEDFMYSIAAVILLPAMWEKFNQS